MNDKNDARQGKPLGQEIMDLVPASQARDMFCDFGELALDATMDEGVMKDVPIVGTFFKIGSAYVAIKDKIFLKKVARFLRALEHIPKEQVSAFVDELRSREINLEVGEKIILLLDRQADVKKAALIGEAFGLYVQGRVTLERFESLCHAVTLCHVEHLWYLERARGHGVFPRDLPDSVGSTFTAIGVAELTLDTYSATASGLMKTRKSYKLSQLGGLLAVLFAEWKAKEERRASGSRDT